MKEILVLFACLLALALGASAQENLNFSNRPEAGRGGIVKKSTLLRIFCTLFVFCIATAIASPAQLTTLHSFDGADGAGPYAGLVQGTDGNFYGTTEDDGAHGDGTVFKITPSGGVIWVYSFCSEKKCADGISPSAGLVQGTDSNFYGTTYGGGANGDGTVFKITPSGTLNTLYSFCSQKNCADGAFPYAGLVQATDGNFYGTTYEGGANGDGTVFKITPSGTLNTLYSFCSKTGCADGSEPYAALVQATDGNFYGTTFLGGAKNDGTVFKITPSGTLNTLYSFCSKSGCADGANPIAGLVQATDGNFYGTTEEGGVNSKGTVFKITPSGTLTPLYDFCFITKCVDGAYPSAGLVQGTDGNFYGTTSEGGANGDGMVFKITPSGLTLLYSFCSKSGCADGSQPAAGLVQATDGNFYGTTYNGGANGDGTVFKLSTGIVLSPVQFVPVTPCRLLDTRQGEGGNGAITGGTYQTFILPALAEEKGCPDLSSAAAYSLNVTAVPHEPLGYLTIWPAGRSLPLVSTLNSVDGRVKAAAAIIPAGATQAVSVYVSDTSDVILDIDGYFEPSNGSTLEFYTLTPCRVVDTRNAKGPLGGPYLGGGVQRDFPVLGSPCFEGIGSLAGYSFNITAIPHEPLGYLTAWPAGQTQPPVSTLNAVTGAVTANAAIVPAGTDGDIDVYASNDTDLLIDVNGYFAAPGGKNALQLYPVVPCRVLDTRNGIGAFSNELTVPVEDSPCAPPSTAHAYVFNATVVPSGPLGYLTLWPDGSSQPVVSTLNAVDGTVTSNLAIVPNSDGKSDAYASSLTQLVLDIFSYFAP